MRIAYSDNAIRGMVKDGLGKSDAVMVLMAVTHPQVVSTTEDGQARFEGYGTTVTGRIDRTGKFLTVNRVKVDKRP
jgi:hypothetical protein